MQQLITMEKHVENLTYVLHIKVANCADPTDKRTHELQREGGDIARLELS